MGFLSRLIGKRKMEEVIYIPDNKVDEENQFLKKRLLEVSEQYDKLMRIMKYTDFTSNEPKFHLKDKQRCDHLLYLRYEQTLYIYINREEYRIVLKELTRYCSADIKPESCSLSTTSDPGLLLFECCAGKIPGFYIHHKFIIDYEQGHYVHSEEEVNG